MDDHGPAWELIVGISISYIDIKFEASEMVGFGFGIDGNQAKPAGFLVCLFVSIFVDTGYRITYCVDVDFISATIKILSGILVVVCWAILICHAKFVG